MLPYCDNPNTCQLVVGWYAVFVAVLIAAVVGGISELLIRMRG